MKNSTVFYFTIALCITAMVVKGQTSFTAAPDSGCAPLNVTFTNTSTGIAAFSWDFGDGQTFSGTDTSHTYTIAGVYTVTVVGFDTAANPVDTATATITVEGSSGTFVISNDSVCPFEAIFFTSNDFSTSYNWSFGDGSTDSGQFVIYAYFADGVYQVDLVINTVCGLDTITDSVFVNSGFAPPAPVITAFPDTICPGETVLFTADIDASVPYVWDFGDGTLDSTSGVNFGNTQFISHAYVSAGDFTATLTISNACGNTNSSSYPVVVNNSAIPPPPTITNFQDSICPGETINFTANIDSTTPYLWDFGDGTLDSTGVTFIPFFGTPIISHVYADTGTYIVSLTIQNQCGNSNTGYDTVHVINNSVPAPPLFFTSGDSVCPGDAITFSVFLDPALPFALWNFGDGAVDTSYPLLFGFHTITHSFSSAGSYTVTLSIVNQCGNTGSVSDTITIINSSVPAKPNIAVFPSACVGDAVTFTVFMSPPASYVWNFGDGTLDSISAQDIFGIHTITHVYSTAGSFDATLTISNSCGNTNSDTANIVITPQPDAVINQSGDTLWVEDTFASYEWYHEDSIIQGDTTNMHIATANGNYFVIVSDANLCLDTSEVVTVFLNIREFKPSAFKLDVSPNPLSSQTRVTYTLNEKAEVWLEIYNLLGEKVALLFNAEQSRGEHHYTLDAENLIAGIYLVKLQVGSRFAYSKISVVR